MEIPLVEYFGCPCGEGAGRLVSCVTSFTGQAQIIVYRHGQVGTLATANHDGVYLEVCCPRGHVFFVEITIDADGGEITQSADVDPD